MGYGFLWYNFDIWAWIKQRVSVILHRNGKCKKYLIVINWRQFKLFLSREYTKTVDMYDEITG